MTNPDDPFHPGERAVQDRVGVPQEWREMAARAIRPTMLTQHQAFFESLPMLFLGLQDRQGRPWATLCPLPSGARAKATELIVPHRPMFADRLGLDLQPGAKLAVLGLDFATRRRNRMNGAIASVTQDALTIAVEQSYGNCPKYIRPREVDWPAAALPPATMAPVALDDATVQRIIASADTFFIATHAKSGSDVSHRGGTTGFLRTNGNGSLSFPDYAGNRFFNTLGNLMANSRAGLFIPDFATGDAILLTGRAGVDWSAARAAKFDGAERIVDIQPDEIWHAKGAFPGDILTARHS